MLISKMRIIFRLINIDRFVVFIYLQNSVFFPVFILSEFSHDGVIRINQNIAIKCLKFTRFSPLYQEKIEGICHVHECYWKSLF